MKSSIISTQKRKKKVKFKLKNQNASSITVVFLFWGHHQFDFSYLVQRVVEFAEIL